MIFRFLYRILISAGHDGELELTVLTTNKNASFKLYPDLNHLLSSQKEKGTGAQYRTPANVSPVLINDISLWIKGK